MRLSSFSALALLSVLFYLANANSSSDDTPVSLANLPEKMSEMGKFLQSLQGRLKKSTRASPEIGLIMRRTMLREIEEKRAVVDSIDQLIRLLFQSGTMARDDRVELELHLRNCKAFKTLTDEVVQKIRELNPTDK